MKDFQDALLVKIEAFLRRHDLTPTAFGQAALKDPRFVFDLRDGRECRRAVREKVLAFMQNYRVRAA